MLPFCWKTVKDFTLPSIVSSGRVLSKIKSFLVFRKSAPNMQVISASPSLSFCSTTQPTAQLVGKEEQDNIRRKMTVVLDLGSDICNLKIENANKDEHRIKRVWPLKC